MVKIGLFSEDLNLRD